MEKIVLIVVLGFVLLSGCSSVGVSEEDKSFLLSDGELSELGLNIEKKCNFYKKVVASENFNHTDYEESCGWGIPETSKDKIEIKVIEFTGNPSEADKWIELVAGTRNLTNFGVGEKGFIDATETPSGKTTFVQGIVKQGKFIVDVSFTPEEYQREESNEKLKNIIKKVLSKLP